MSTRIIGFLLAVLWLATTTAGAFLEAAGSAVAVAAWSITGIPWGVAYGWYWHKSHVRKANNRQMAAYTGKLKGSK